MSLGHLLLLDGRNAEQGVALKTGKFEESAVMAARALLGERPVALDIGANIGFYACPLGLACKAAGGKVHAFEPVKANARRLKENLRLNEIRRDVVEVHGIALGEKSATCEIYIEPQGDTNNAVCDFMTAAHDRANMTHEGWRRETIDVRRLDDWVARTKLEKIDLMKMDVEGAELKVLRGGPQTVEQYRPVILAEFNPYWMAQAGESLADAGAWLCARGYDLFREEGDGFRELGAGYAGDSNIENLAMYLAVPREKREWAAGRVVLRSGV